MDSIDERITWTELCKRISAEFCKRSHFIFLLVTLGQILR